MFNVMRTAPWTGGWLALCLASAGCAPHADVSLTGNAPAQYTHVFVTTQAIWFNTSATAGPGETGWTKLTLNDPVTVDLLSSLDGTLTALATNMQVPAGTYSQVRLIPVDASVALTPSASALGAIYNSEADYEDSSNASHQVPLELLNPDVGIGISTSLKVAGNGSTTFSATTTSSSGTSSSTTSGSTTSSSTTAPKVALALNLDGSRDLVPFTYSGAGITTLTGVLLNPHMTAYDTSQAGGIQGALTLTGLTNVTNPNNNRVDIQVTAETLSADGTRHIAVNSAAVRSDGTFLVYPLATSTDTPSSYDLVIHGPAIATIIVKGIPVTAGDPNTTSPVSVGTLVPRAATPYTVHLTTTNPLPAGALVGFYQTLPDSGEVPYLIEEQPIDPFSRAFATDPSVSAATLDYGTYSTDGAPSMTSATPSEGTSTYRVSASAPLFADGVLTTTVTPPTSGTGPVPVAAPTLSAVSGATAVNLSALVNVTAVRAFNQGDLILSHDGAVVATAPLNPAALALGGSTTVTINGVPAGSLSSTFDQGLYYLSVRAWNTGQTDHVPASVVWESYPVPVDLRSTSTASISLNID